MVLVLVLAGVRISQKKATACSFWGATIKENPAPLCKLYISYALLQQDVIDVFGLSNMNKQHESLHMNLIAFFIPSSSLYLDMDTSKASLYLDLFLCFDHIAFDRPLPKIKAMDLKKI